MKKKFTFKNSKGVSYNVVTKKIPKKAGAVGLCFPPFGKNPRIELEESMTDRKRLSVVIEEFTHAFYWQMPEKTVRKFAATVAKFLYKDNWRKMY